jgi:protein-S-isoprenylcysteine O-methyltransferase Ste14
LIIDVELESLSSGKTMNGATVERTFISLGKFFFKYRNGLFPAVYLCLVLITRPGLFLGDAQLDKYACALGALLALSGQAFRMLVIGLAYIIRGGKSGKVYAESLVQTGIYAHTRNPMYVGNYLILVGLVLLYGSLWGYVIVLPFFTLVYYAIVKNEESYLKEKFGREYAEYGNKVNRFIPNLSGIKHTLRMHDYDWGKAISKDYGTIAFVLIGILSLLIWKDVTIFGYEHKQSEIEILTLMFIPVFLFYGIARYLKKTGRLVKQKPA